jgi:hypothetical protein
MKKYIVSSVVGISLGMLFLATASCVGKPEVQPVDGGVVTLPQPVEGTMSVGTPVIHSVPDGGAPLTDIK